MYLCRTIISFSLLALCQAGVDGTDQSDEYLEEVVVTPHDAAYVGVQLSFLTRRFAPLGTGQYDLFPKLIGELLQQYRLQELHLSLVHGRWWTQRWGFPRDLSVGPAGAEIVALFRPDVPEKSVDKIWTNLVHALSGLFCASLTQLVPTMTAAPNITFHPYGFVEQRTPASKQTEPSTSQRRYAALGSENVCTENLTPWKRLLPCKGAVGLGAFLNPIRLYSANYHALSLHVEARCADGKSKCSQPVWSCRQSLHVVFPRSRPDIDLKALLGSSITAKCAVSSSSNVYFDESSDRCSQLSYSLNGSQSVVTKSGAKFARFDVNDYFDSRLDDKSSGFNVRAVVKPVGHPECRPAGPKVTLHCYVAGTGQQEGTYRCQMENAYDTDKRMLYAQLVPWYMRVYLHTIRFECKKTASESVSGSGNKEGQRIRKINFRPARTRLRPTFMELLLDFPAASRCQLSFRFEKALLRWTEYPPDAHHGFSAPGPSLFVRVDSDELKTGTSELDVGPFSLNEFNVNSVVRLVAETFLISLPTPDFSMPYNVICLVCTVVALAFGPIHNLTTKRMVLKDPAEVAKSGVRSKLKGILEKVKSKIVRRKQE